jgi:acyl-CoA synthetase (AMP-forming)/AMP-acid ligase II
VPEVLLEATEEALPDVQPLPAGQVGEIMVAGDQVMQGYWNQPDASAAALRGGWMHTGDAGYLDSAGNVYVVDRIKDMIITGGETCTPQRSKTPWPRTRPWDSAPSSELRTPPGASGYTR